MERLGNLNLHFKGTQNGSKSVTRPSFRGNFVDAWSYLNMDEFLSPEAIEIKKKCEKFATEINPTLYDYAETATFPHHLIPRIADLGISGADIPKEFGGKGLSVTDCGSFMYELARKDASIATFYLLHSSLGLFNVLKLASPTLRDSLLKETIPLKKVLAWGLTEPDHGSNASGIESTATKVDGGYLLNGKKRWIGNATFSDYIIVWARNTAE